MEKDWANAVWELASKFAEVRGKAIVLQLLDKKFIRDVYIAPAAIAMGNLRVVVQPQPLASKSNFRRWTTYDLALPPIGSGDVEELAALAGLLLRLEPYFQEKE